MAGILMAHAKLIPYYQMDSYAFLSDDVVLCDEKSVQFKQVQHEKWTEVKTVVLCKVLRTFKGNIYPAEEFQIEYDSIFKRNLLGKEGHVEEDSTGKVERIVQPEYLPAGRALLFLKKEKNTNSQNIITAKLIQTDQVYRFVQGMNPGPLILFPQEPENIKLKDGQKYGEAELIEDLLIALKKETLLKKPVPDLHWWISSKK
jgi:hypothetical protein